MIFHAFEILFFWDMMRHALQVGAVNSSEMSVLSPHVSLPRRLPLNVFVFITWHC